MNVLMHIEKDYLIKSKTRTVWKFITDLKNFGTCIPNVENYKEINNRHFIVTVKPKFVFLEGTIIMDWVIVRLGKNNGELRIKGKAVGSAFDLLSKLKVLNKNNNSLLKWEVDVLKLTGLLKAVPKTIIKAVGIKLADEIFDNLKTKINN
jgi:carbon monoxide dehydrogenase subunit G